MMRIATTILLLAVFFLAGMVYGLERDTTADENQNIKVIETEKIEERAEKVEQTEEDLTVYPSVHDQLDELDKPVYFTEKLASMLEIGVKGFYEGIVKLLYAFSEQFF